MSWDLVETAKELIGLRSITTEGNRRVVDFLLPLCKALGWGITLQDSDEKPNEVNLLVHTVPEGTKNLCPQGLLLVTHLDTVPPGDPKLWTETGGDPFRATIRGDRIYGLGSADTKLDFLCKLKGIESVGPARFKAPVCLVGSYGEERGLSGIRALRRSGRVDPRYALVGEPSELKPVSTHKGILYMRVIHITPLPPLSRPSTNARDTLSRPPRPTRVEAGRGEREIRKKTFLGRAAHGSTPHLGENAIEKACRWLFEERQKNRSLQLLSIDGGSVHNIVPESCSVTMREGDGPCPRIDFLRRFWELYDSAVKGVSELSDEAFDPPVTTGNVGVIRGDEGGIEIEFDFRLIPACDGNELFQIFTELDRTEGVRLEVISSNPVMQTPGTSEIAQRVARALQGVGLSAEFQAKAGNTEGAVVNQMGAEAIVIGPGRSTGNIHRPNEYNEISQLKKAVEFYTLFLRQF